MKKIQNLKILTLKLNGREMVERREEDKAPVCWFTPQLPATAM